MTPQTLSHVVVAVATRSGVNPLTAQCIDQLLGAGATVASVANCSDVALARNLLLTRVLRLVPPERTTILMVDDDMSFERKTAEAIVEAAEDGPTSACYLTSAGALAHHRRGPRNWLTGLGFLAVKRTDLQALADKLEPVTGLNGEKLLPFCQCGPRDGQWWSEDYWLTDALGGVRLARVAVGHIKQHVMMPEMVPDIWE